jgi:hypothetical protein
MTRKQNAQKLSAWYGERSSTAQINVVKEVFVILASSENRSQSACFATQSDCTLPEEYLTL